MKTNIRIIVIATAASFAAACAQAQGPSCITITDTLYAVGSALPITMNGTIAVQLGYTVADGALNVTQSGTKINVVAGALSTCLAPGNYDVVYSVPEQRPLTGTSNYPRSWTVPSSGGPYTVQEIETQTPGPTPLSTRIACSGAGAVVSQAVFMPQVSACANYVGQTATLTFNLLANPVTGDYVLNDYWTTVVADGSATVDYTVTWMDESGIVIASSGATGFVNQIGSGSAVTLLFFGLPSASISVAQPEIIHAVSGTPISVSITVSGATALVYSYHATLVRNQ